MRVQISRQSCVFLATVYSPATLRAQNFRAATALHLRRFSATQKGIGNGSHKNIAYWLLSMSGLVAGMVTIGGITRITRSGLSMTDWKLQGSLPPLTLEQWSLEFERYKTFPEWKQRQSMSLDEFKFIYFWEYGHRMMGRFLGIAFTVPLAIFAIRGNIPNFLYPRLGLLFGLGGTQVSRCSFLPLPFKMFFFSCEKYSKSCIHIYSIEQSMLFFHSGIDRMVDGEVRIGSGS